MSNETQINLNSELITKKLNDGDISYCIELLKEEFKLKLNNQNKPEPYVTWHFLLLLLFLTH